MNFTEQRALFAWMNFTSSGLPQLECLATATGNFRVLKKKQFCVVMHTNVPALLLLLLL